MPNTKVDIFLCNTRKTISEKLLFRYFELLPQNEKMRLSKLSSSKQRRLLVSLALLYSQLAEKTEQLPEELNIQYNVNGKPYLGNFSEHTFNLSHSKDFTALAITQQDPVGLDIENVDFCRTRLSDIAKRFFTLKENKILSALGGDEHSLMFYRLWTLKEAWVKANGGSLIPNLKKIEFLVVENKLLVGNQTELQDGQFLVCRPSKNLMLSFCTLNSNQGISISDVEIKAGLPLKSWSPIKQPNIDFMS